MPRLFILRHAKSAPSAHGTPDHDRPLAPRGRRALAGVATEIASHLGGRPLDVVLCSTATRARETAAGVLATVASREERDDPRLYLADVEQLLELLAELPDDVATALVCGHNPGLHELALTLIGDDAAPAALRQGLPTAGLVVVDLELAWTSIGPGTATLTAFGPAD
ncbi:MAG: phosphohistidine phosphatase [Actinomycetota bacterium]|nr:phosphohistidine phosphatase [Actinomycetota bacterium]